MSVDVGACRHCGGGLLVLCDIYAMDGGVFAIASHGFSFEPHRPDPVLRYAGRLYRTDGGRPLVRVPHGGFDNESQC
jgi:hypothetical protein